MTGPVNSPAQQPAAGHQPAAGEPGRAETPEFDQEIRSAVRYEKGLAVKAVAALAIVVLVILIRVLFPG